jgi:hypothetical protein
MATWFTYTMRIISISMVVVILAVGCGWSQQVNYNKDPFILSFPRRLDLNKLWIKYSVTGAFGGVGGPVESSPGVWDYMVATTHENEPVESLKVAFYVPGYQMQAMDLSSQLYTTKRKYEIHLNPLGTVPFSGRLLSITGKHLQGISIDIDYIPGGVCEFFNDTTCGWATLKIDSIKLDEKGRFKVLLPDFFHDKTIRSFRTPGHFVFTINENLVMKLIPVAKQYPSETIFKLEGD